MWYFIAFVLFSAGWAGAFKLVSGIADDPEVVALLPLPTDRLNALSGSEEPEIQAVPMDMTGAHYSSGPQANPPIRQPASFYGYSGFVSQPYPGYLPQPPQPSQASNRQTGQTGQAGRQTDRTVQPHVPQFQRTSPPTQPFAPPMIQPPDPREGTTQAANDRIDRPTDSQPVSRSGDSSPGPNQSGLTPHSRLQAKKRKAIQPIQLPTDEGQYFDWQELEDATKHPHLLILGKSGAGKTTLARMLLEWLDGQAMVITPHVKPGDWDSSINVVGAGRKYPAIERTLSSLVAEMTRRYELRSAGVEDYLNWSVVIDETSSIMAQCPNAGAHLRELVREARKVKIRLIVLAHGMSVKELGCEGEGAVRKNYTFIKLRGFIPDSQLKQLEQEFDYPALVNDVPANVNQLPEADAPVFREGQSGNFEGVSEPSVSISENDFFVAETDFPVSEREIKGFEPETEKARNVLETAWEKTGNAVSDHPRNPISRRPVPEDCSQPPAFGLDDLSAEACRQRIQELKNLNYGITKIVELIWGVSAGGGPAYKQARDQYRTLTGE